MVGPPVIHSVGFLRHQTRQMASLKEGIKLVRRVIAQNEFPQGITTAELYKLALKEPAPAGFTHDVPEILPRRNTHTGRMNPVHMPEHIHHPVRSMKYLKSQILPVLEGAGEIAMSQTPRMHTQTFGLPQNPPKKKRKGKQDERVFVEASEEAPVTTKVWCWKKIDPSLWNSAKQVKAAEEKREAAAAEKPVVGQEIGLFEDWDHLSKRRERARRRTIMKDLSVMKVLELEKTGQLGETMALASKPLSERFSSMI